MTAEELDSLVDQSLALNRRLRKAYDSRPRDQVKIERVWWKAHYRLNRRWFKLYGYA